MLLRFRHRLRLAHENADFAHRAFYFVSLRKNCARSAACSQIYRKIPLGASGGHRFFPRKLLLLKLKVQPSQYSTGKSRLPAASLFPPETLTTHSQCPIPYSWVSMTPSCFRGFPNPKRGLNDRLSASGSRSDPS